MNSKFSNEINKLKNEINVKVSFFKLLMSFLKIDNNLLKNFVFEELKQNLDFFNKLSTGEKEELIHLFFNFLKNIKVSNEKDKHETLTKITSKIYPKYKISEFNNLMFEEVSFIDFYKKFMDKENWYSFDRKYNLKNLLELTNLLTGDIVEAGAYQGFSSYLMCEFVRNNKSKKLVHLFDSFEGLSEPSNFDDLDWWKKGQFNTNPQIILNNLAEFNNFKIYKGWIPNVYSNLKIEKVSFLHIDVDLYQPTLDTLNYFYERMEKDGLILFDDYNFKNCKGHKLAIDEFFIGKKEKVIKLSSGQAFIIKF